MKRWLIVTLSVVIVLALIVGGAAYWLTRPTKAQNFTPAVDQHAVARNTAGVSVLEAAGIHDAFVQVDTDRVLVAFPADAARGNDTAIKAMMETALATAAGIDKPAAKAYILSTMDTAPYMAWQADLKTFPDVVSGKVTFDAYLASAVNMTTY